MINVNRIDWKYVAIGIGAVLVLGLIVFFSAKGHQAFEKKCKDEFGGRVDDRSTTSQTYGTYTNPQGKQVTGNHTTTTNVTYCVGKNGEILDQM